MSEKMDGIRAYWNGEILLSRQGKVIHSPDCFVKGFPSFALDGELWMGRGSFQDIIETLNKKNGDWSKIRYFIFDLPGSKQNFEKRMQELEQLKQQIPSHLHIVEHIKCLGKQHLESYLDSIITSGGEGIMVREPSSLYTVGFTTSLLKVKVNLLYYEEMIK